MHRTDMHFSNYDQSSEIKANKCKTIVTFDTLLESKILDASDILILSNLQKPWTIVCKDVNRTFDLEYSTYHIINRSELCECSLMAGNYLLSQAASNCGGMPEVKDGFFTTYYAFSRIVLDMLMKKFDVPVDEDTVTQLTLLHSDRQAMTYQPLILCHHQKKHRKAAYSKNRMLPYIHT